MTGNEALSSKLDRPIAVSGVTRVQPSSVFVVGSRAEALEPAGTEHLVARRSASPTLHLLHTPLSGRRPRWWPAVSYSYIQTYNIMYQCITWIVCDMLLDLHIVPFTSTRDACKSNLCLPLCNHADVKLSKFNKLF